MKRGLCLAIAVMMIAVCGGSAMAEQKVYLPESRYSLTLPDEMKYDGPGVTAGDDAEYAYVSAALGLEIDFFLHDNSNGSTLEGMAKGLKESGQETSIRRISGVDMLVYETTDPTDGAPCIGYVLLDGNRVQEICFWYYNQQAADLTETIISSITDKD